MGTLRRLTVVLALSAATAVAVAGAAGADGGPSPGISLGGNGVAGAGGRLRYVAVSTDRGTLVESIRVSDGHVIHWKEIRGFFGVPIVTSDGVTGGLSHDLKTLILESYVGTPSGNTVSRFAVLDTRQFRVRRTITLRGSYAFDALSPDASTLYVIQYTSSQNANRYRVRAYDLVRGRLLAGAIVDKREPAEAMQGSPMTRVTSVDGAWVYTLYARPSGGGFIHALDALHRAAACIDLPWKSVAPGALWRVRMAISGSRIVLTQRPIGRLATVDTRTFTVRSQRAPVADGAPVG
jgi:hypothetical protein